MTLEVGMKNSVTLTVTDEMCADHLDSQLPQIELPHVFSTPSMVNLIELTCAELMIKHAEEGMFSVGMAVDVRHVASTPAGKSVSCVAEVAEIDGRKVLFNVTCTDENGKIGFGTHRRAYVKK